MKRYSGSLLVQFSVVSLVVMVMIAVLISTLLSVRLGRDIDLLRQHGATMMAGTMIKDTDVFSIPSLVRDVRNLRFMTLGAVGGGFVVLYGSLVLMVWRASRTIATQQTDLAKTNRDLEEANLGLREAQERLVRSERLAAIGELAAGVAHELRNPLGAIKNALYYINGRLRGSSLITENPRVGEFLEIMDEEVGASDKIITDLMDFSRVNPPNLSPTQLETV